MLLKPAFMFLLQTTRAKTITTMAKVITSGVNVSKKTLTTIFGGKWHF
jgi:hypothetical protein